MSVSYLELTLISISIVASVLLSVIPSQRDRTLTQGIRPSLWTTVLAFVLAFTTFGIILAALILAWIPLLSLDAFTAIVFTLIPALINMPVDLLQDVMYRISRRHYPSLHIRNSDFCYLRIGVLTCCEQRWKGGWFTLFHNSNDQLICRDNKCGAHIFVRYHPENSPGSDSNFGLRSRHRSNTFSNRPVPGQQVPIRSIGFLHHERNAQQANAQVASGPRHANQDNRTLEVALPVVEQHGQPPSTLSIQRSNNALVSVAVDRGLNLGITGQVTGPSESLSGTSSGHRTSPTPPTASTEEQASPGDTQWFGKRIGHTVHCVQLADVNDGMIVWWWNALMSASPLVAFPQYARLQHRYQVLNALSLLSDVIRVGDFILEYRRPFFEWLFKNDMGTRRGLISTPAIMCNLIVRRIPLEEWSAIPKFIPNDFTYPLSRDDGYPLLFYLLAERSRIFTLPRQEKSSANVIIEEALKADFSSRADFNINATKWVDDWLSAWGMEPELIREFDQS